ncbi:hypothetical protein Tco_0255086 [Tanacetum coccineum]
MDQDSANMVAASKVPMIKHAHGHSHWISNLARKEDPRELFNELMDTPQDLLAFVLNWLKVDTLTLELLTGLTFKSMISGGVSSRTYATSVTKTKAEIMDTSNGLKTWSQTPCGVKCQLSTTNMHYGASLTGDENINNSMDTHLIGNPASYDDKLYTFKEGDYNRLRLQDIEDMLLLLVQGKLTNLNIEERLALGVSLRMFTRSIVIRRRVEDLQLGIERFIYQNKDKKNRLMRIDKLHKFSDGTLTMLICSDDTSKRTREVDVDPHGFEGYLKMDIEVPGSS